MMIEQNSRVDITKLTYSPRYDSYLKERDLCARYSGCMVQYLRFVAIIGILESIMLDSLNLKNLNWLIASSVCTILALSLGKRAVGSRSKSLVLFLLTTLVSLGFYFSN